MSIIENLRTEKSVEARIARRDTIRTNRWVETFSLAGLDDLCRPLVLVEVVIIFGKRRGDALEYMAIGIAIDHIGPNIFDFSISPILSNVVVDPSNQDLFVSETLHDVWLFIILPEENDFRISFEGNFAGDVDLSD